MRPDTPAPEFGHPPGGAPGPPPPWPSAAPMPPGPIHTGAMPPGPMHTGPMPPGPMHTGPMPPGPMYTGPIPPGPMPAPPLRRHPQRTPLADVLIVAALALPALLMAQIPLFGQMGSSTNADRVAATVALVGTLVALVLRRSRPLSSAAVVYLLTASQLFIAPGPNLASSLVLISLYSVTVFGPAWAGRIALGAALLGALLLGVWLYLVLEMATFTVLIVTVVVVATLFVWALGLVRRSRWMREESLAERAARLERERDQQAQLATAAERARIAREMHDVVAHSLSVVIAQADGGRYAATTDPEAATRALSTISEIGRAALADMRRILGVLREPDARRAASGPGVPRSTQRADTAPQPMDADLDDLVEQIRQAGVQVSVVRVGQARQLPPGAGLTVYRICQEALTNVLKHAGPEPHVTLLLQWTPQRLTIQIDDDGRGAAASADGGMGGFGLLGMRERAALFDGTVFAGPREGGGFRVRVEIPVPTGAAVVPPPPRHPEPAEHWPPHHEGIS